MKQFQKRQWLTHEIQLRHEKKQAAFELFTSKVVGKKMSAKEATAFGQVITGLLTNQIFGLQFRKPQSRRIRPYFQKL